MSVPENVVRARIKSLYEMLLRHDGFGDLRIETRILKKGAKEVIVSCGKQHRFVVETPAADPREGAAATM